MMKVMLKATRTIQALSIAILVTFCQPIVFADGGVTFTDIAAGGGAGIDFSRVPSSDHAWFADNENTIFFGSPGAPQPFRSERSHMPVKDRGIPGIVVFDYDNDGDLDIYVTNGPGAGNSLFSNQLMETGITTFVDMAAIAGVTASSQDSSGSVASGRHRQRR